MKERKTIRLPGYDYSSDNLYYVTSCVHDRICCFGEITNATMILNEYGKIAERQWFWLGEQYPYIVLHTFVVMPNHIHGIIEIKRDSIRVRTGRVRTGRDLSLPEIKIKSFSELMGAYKSTVSKNIHLTGYTDFIWQRSFYEHIIRDEASFQNITNYIIDNPLTWEHDNYYNS